MLNSKIVEHSPYTGNGYYTDRHEKTVHSANKILSVVLDVLPNIRSAVDVGCGIGTWLSVLKEKGVEEIYGLDGDWVDKDLLEISKDCFTPTDLSQAFTLDQKCDLALTLEVAEHLPEASANNFVRSITNLSDFILFSAAIPQQGGRSHVNEQWLEYWMGLFKEYGFIGLDIVRKKIWNDQAIPYWYKQNLVLFVKESRISEIRLTEDIESLHPISLIHPDKYLAKLAQMSTLRGSWKLFHQACKNRIRRLWTESKSSVS